MKITNSLKVGDWIVTSDDIKTGKFTFGKITGFKIDEYFDIDLDKQEIANNRFGGLNGESYVRVLNKRELDGLLKLKLKLGIIKGLEDDETKIKSR